MQIIKDITSVNRDIANNRSIKYIVIHYVGAVSTARNNGAYFRNVNRQASAHYFIDENDIVQVVEDKDIAWSVGATSYKHPICRNSNSLNIEMCCKNNGNWYIEDATVNKTIELTKVLMAKYNVPIENVLRHYDVTGKNCPEPFVRQPKLWNNFKNALVGNGSTNNTVSNNIIKVVYPNDKIGLNIRAGAGTNYAKVGAVTYGTAINIYEEKNGWGRTDSGWVCLTYTTSSTPNTTFWVRVDKGCGANVRSQPNTHAPLAGSKFLKKGDTFKTVGIVAGENVNNNNLWYESAKGNFVWAEGVNRI